MDWLKRYEVSMVDARDQERIASRIEEGWEVALQTPETVYFRRKTRRLRL